MSSAICSGIVTHDRLMAPKHRFWYRTHMLWLDLDELTQLRSFWRKPIAYFRRDDYYGDGDLKQDVLTRMSELAGQTLTGKVFLLGQIRYFGIYFSPINFYLLQQHDNYTHLLAEVSNTPWNQRHHYLVPLTGTMRSDKAFHVSPFMPAAMEYRWRVKLTEQRIRIDIECHQQSKAFWAGLDLTMQPLNQNNFTRVLRQIPWMTVKTVAAIYYQALQLLIKRAPFYPHSGQSGDSGCSSK
ncbi:DUF1365 domain-containing protein [Ferrimonas lipolytica]|uniref:DUF1365 domain-containing protein n=1 Tax=Ferrimonas lipolytica TaxID=2724191 RepID=A0A6H1UA27_9GAMM|nr:DUF1365 domain-containing protein [Ferrimonas lipolytica]QIZ75678.1 DUF1365 domain-containing protein [Ferrimonas lipolytica]